MTFMVILAIIAVVLNGATGSDNFSFDLIELVEKLKQFVQGGQ
jgi:hypothetical protein